MSSVDGLTRVPLVAIIVAVAVLLGLAPFLALYAAPTRSLLPLERRRRCG
jgi:hypothetical protein